MEMQLLKPDICAILLKTDIMQCVRLLTNAISVEPQLTVDGVNLLKPVSQVQSRNALAPTLAPKTGSSITNVVYPTSNPVISQTFLPMPPV